MNTISLADAASRLDDLVARVEAGESFDILRDGVVVARLVAAARPRKPVDAAMLRALTEGMPPQTQTAADLVRRMRDEDRF